MRYSLVQLLVAGAVGVAAAVSGSPAFPKTAKECGAEYTLNEDAIKTTGETKKDYIAACQSAPTAPLDEAQAPTEAVAAVAGKTAKECNAEYLQKKAAIKASGGTKKEFVAFCRAGTKAIPAAAPAPVAPTAAATPDANPAPDVAATPAPDATAPIVPEAKPATPKAKPKPKAESKPDHAVSTNANWFASAEEANVKCPSDTVVWTDKKSKIYHLPGTREYAGAKQGAYMCEADAKAAGSHSAKNDKQP
jgi:hypothetical protein